MARVFHIIAVLQPDVIYFGGIDATGGTLIRQQMQQVPGLEHLPFIGADGIVTPRFASTIGLVLAAQRGVPIEMRADRTLSELHVLHGSHRTESPSHWPICRMADRGKRMRRPGFLISRGMLRLPKLPLFRMTMYFASHASRGPALQL